MSFDMFSILTEHWLFFSHYHYLTHWHLSCLVSFSQHLPVLPKWWCVARSLTSSASSLNRLKKVIYDCKRQSSSERCVLALLWKTQKLHELLLDMKINLQDFCIFWPVTQNWYTDVTEGLKRLKACHMGLQHHHWSHLSQHVEGDFKHTTSLVYPELLIIHEQHAFFSNFTHWRNLFLQKRLLPLQQTGFFH